MFTRKMRAGIVFSLILACIVIVAIALYADAPRLILVLAQFHWVYLPLILALVLFNYLGRFIKWQYYLRRLQIRLSWRTSLLIFLSGLSMAITPGKVGELLKSYQLKRSTGAAISRTVPIILAERLTDGIAMLMLASTGLVIYGLGWGPALVLLIIILAGTLFLQNRVLALKLLNLGERLPGVSRISHQAHIFYESTYTLLQWRPLLLAVAIGIVSWLGECGALYFVYTGLGIADTFDLFIKATFILAMSSLIGSATALPGGLGTTDGSILGLSRLLVSTSSALGGTATLLIRFCTLWFALLLGVTALLIFRATQHADFAGTYSFAWGDGDHAINTHLPVPERTMSHAPAPAPANTGEKIV